MADLADSGPLIKDAVFRRTDHVLPVAAFAAGQLEIPVAVLRVAVQRQMAEIKKTVVSAELIGIKEAPQVAEDQIHITMCPIVVPL